MKYRVIVADPPWPYPGGVSAGGTPGKPVKSFKLPYKAMTLSEIAALPVAELADEDCWLFLWTTNRYLPEALRLGERWGFEYRQTVVWAKLGASPFGGTFTHNAAEFLLVCACGSPPVLARWQNHGSVVTTNRMGAGSHSRKPEVFLDEIEMSCEGPRVELFARRNRLGWDTWGDQSLGTATLGVA